MLVYTAPLLSFVIVYFYYYYFRLLAPANSIAFIVAISGLTS